MPSLPDLLRPLLLPTSIITATKLPRGRGGGAAPLLSTKFGGTPYSEENDWPICGNCENPLSFIFQCNLADCPHQKAQGLFTFFYCHECSPWGDDDFEDAWLVRRYNAPDKASAFELDNDSPARTNPCSTQLQVAQSLPNWESINDLAPEIAKLSASANSDEPWAAYQQALEQLLGGEPELNTAIGGYPQWIQGTDFPSCPNCSKRTRLLAQIDSEEEAGIMWGDSGMVYLFECPKHPDLVQMRVQCF